MFNLNEETITVCKEAFSRFLGTGLYVGLFLMLILYVFSNIKKDDKNRNKIRIIFGVYCIIVLILNLCPFFTKFYINLLGEKSTYWRVYWLLPIGIGISFLLTEIIFKTDNKKYRIFLGILSVFIIILSGHYMYNKEDTERFTKVGNYYKIPDNVLDIIFHISEDDEEYKKLAGSESFIIYTRQVDGKIILSEGRVVDGSYAEDSIVTFIKNNDFENIFNYCINENCNYLVLGKDVEIPNDYISRCNVNKIYENSEYSLYKIDI